MQQEKLQLKNKLNTLFIDSPGSTFSCIQIWFRAGSALENKKDHGIAHFLEHMFFKGNKKVSGKRLANQIESVGGELNAFTSFDYTCYYANMPNNELKQGIKTILEMVSNPAFEIKHLPTERNVVVEELKKSIDNPSQFSFYEIQANFFTKGYDHPVLGNYKTINNFSREQLIEFRNKYYNLNNALLVIAGDLTNKKSIIKEIEKYNIPHGPSSSFPKFNLNTKSKISIHSKDVKMSQINILFQGPEFTDKKSPAEDLAFACLGQGEISRLYTGLVLNNSLANSCSSSTMFFSKGSMHLIRVNFPHEHLSKILTKLKSILRDIYKNGFNNLEINRIKNQYASSKIFEKESIESFSFSLGHSFAQTGSVNSEQEFLDKIRDTTPHDINNSIIDILNRQIHIQLQTPHKVSHSGALNKLKQFEIQFKQLKQINPIKKIKTNTVSKFDPQLKLISLKKGINLLYRQNLMTPTYALHTYLRGGLIDETNKSNGLYNLITGTLTKGHQGIPYSTTKHQLENTSSSLQCFAGKNAYGLTLHGLTEHFDNTLDIYSGSLLSPDFPQDFIDHEKMMTLRHLQNQKKDPVRQCFLTVSESIFNSHPYSFNNLGNEKNIKSFSRKTILDKHLSRLSESNMLFTYCGDLDFELVQDKILEKIETLKPRKESAYKPIKYLSKKKYDISIPFDREQTQIFIGIPTQGISSDYSIYFNIITTILSGQGSILFEEIREKHGLSYVVQPIHFSALDGGYWGIYMACGNENIRKSLSTLNSIIDKLAINGISEQAFRIAKKMIRGQSLINVQTNEDYANVYSIPLFFGLGIDHFHQKTIKIEQLKYATFQKAIKHMLRGERYTITVGAKRP